MVDLNRTIIITLLGSIGIAVLYPDIIERKNEIKQKGRQVSLFRQTETGSEHTRICEDKFIGQNITISIRRKITTMNVDE